MTSMNPKLGNKFTNTLQATKHLNKMFGNEFGSGFKSSTMLPALIQQCKGVYEEYTIELAKAQTTEATLDALGDMLTFVEGIPFKAGLNISDSLHEALRHVRMGNPRFDVTYLLNMPERLISDYEADRPTPIPLTSIALSAYMDSLYTAYHSIRVMGFDPELVYWEIFKTQMTKLCYSVEEAQEGIESYCKLYSLEADVFSIHRYSNMDTPYYVIKTSKECMFGDKPVGVGKFLKSPKFVEPDFSDLARFRISQVFA